MISIAFFPILMVRISTNYACRFIQKKVNFRCDVDLLAIYSYCILFGVDKSRQLIHQSAINANQATEY